MNILIPDSWLREYLDTKAKPAEIARLLSLAGPSVERIELSEGEPVYDIEVTTNRVDAMSVRGIAREAGAIIPAAKFLVNPHQATLAETLDCGQPVALPVIKVKTDKVRRILAVVLQVTHQPTPALMAKRLTQIGENVHHTIIDITNYVTAELGHPCHAFDYDKIMALGGEIIVTEAKAGQKFTTLDGEEHETYGGEIVFTSKNGEIIDLPAIKGTANTAVDEQTTRVLFWLENMEAMVVRRASMRHAIRTNAAILNEKNVDPQLAWDVLERGVQLYQQFAQAQIISEIFEYFPDQPQPATITLNLAQVSQYLGVALSAATVVEILSSLGFEILTADETGATYRLEDLDGPTELIVRVPSFRAVDVQKPVDLIEEIARIYGYHRLPSNLGFPAVDLPTQSGIDFIWEARLKQFLAAAGLAEVYTYSTVSEEQLTAPAKDYLSLANPLSADHLYLRQTLIPSLLEVYQHNQATQLAKIKGVFELANIYLPAKNGVTEKMKLAILLALPYREALTIVTQMLAQLYLPTLTIEKVATDQAVLKLGDKITLGTIQQFASGQVAFELDLTTLVTKAKKYPKITTTSKYPALTEDLTFVIKNGEIGPIINKIKDVDNLIAAVMLKDIYQCNYTFTITYQSQTQALSSENVAPVRENIVKLMTKMKHQLVGKLS